MKRKTLDSLKSEKELNVNGKRYRYYSISAAAKALGQDMCRLPYSLKVLFENLLRNEDGVTVKRADIEAFVEWLKNKTVYHEIAYRPARVLMQDFTGVPAVVDLAAMRDAMRNLGGDPERINPLSPVDLVIDHSVMVDHYGSKDAFKENVQLEMERNLERYAFLRWGQAGFDNFRVVPPGTGGRTLAPRRAGVAAGGRGHGLCRRAQRGRRRAPAAGEPGRGPRLVGR